jgi:hypothetical protein
MLKSKDYQKKLSPESYDLAYTFCCITYSSVSLEACTDLCINTQFLTAVIITPNKQLSVGRLFFECLIQCFLILSSYYTLFFLMSCTINKVPYSQYNILVESFEGSVNQNTKIR